MPSQENLLLNLSKQGNSFAEKSSQGQVRKKVVSVIGYKCEFFNLFFLFAHPNFQTYNLKKIGFPSLGPHDLHFFGFTSFSQVTAKCCEHQIKNISSPSSPATKKQNENLI